jgi:hypothetical protein
MSIVNRKKKSALFRVFWLRLAQLDQDELEYFAGRMLFTVGYLVCLGLLILMAMSR